MNDALSDEVKLEKAKLLGSFLHFTKVFYQYLTNRPFVISEPIGRESHHITIAKELTKIARLQENRLIINVPPGYGKSTMCCYFIAWCMAMYPDSNILYISYSEELSSKHTFTIKRIMSHPAYKRYFGVELRSDSTAKGNFQTTAGGIIAAFGIKGGVTGQDAGLPNLERYSGMVVIDDAHKPGEVHSDLVRETVINQYKETVKQRPRSPNVGIVFMGQRLHEADLANFLKEGMDGYQWRQVILEALDVNGNALNPALHTKEMLEIEREYNEYVFYSQFQQNPQPSGGALFKRQWFRLVDEEPEFIATFITSDSAETEKEYNDATVFSFWGIYQIKEMGVPINKYALHLIDCVEIRVEPKDLEPEFNLFYTQCLLHKKQPQHAFIEKKSTGVTLISVLKQKQGLTIIEIERTAKSGSKGDRFIQMQPYISGGQISLMSHGKLWYLKDNKALNMFIEHMIKITANQTHRWDDICDSAYDAVVVGLIDKTILHMVNPETTNAAAQAIANVLAANKRLDNLRQQNHNGYRYR